MSKPAIIVENLSKAYRIGLKEEIPDTFFQAATGWMSAPWRNWRRLRRLNTFGGGAASGQQSAVSGQQNGQQSAVSGQRSGNGNGNGADHSPLTDSPNHPPDEADLIWALKDVSFEVGEGEVVGIIGRNGAGKSTLLKVLSRITEPTRGRAVIRGRVSSLLEVGTGFHPELTGRENIYMNGTILGMRKREIDRKFDEIVEFSGVEKFLDTPIKRYSSGMQVRLAFSVAAHLEPEILIIDEVLAVGDAEFQKRCLGKMQDVAGSGRTVLFVSHNMVAVEALCGRAILLRDGTINTDGTVSTAKHKYIEAITEDVKAHNPVRTERSAIRSIQLIDRAGRATSVCHLGCRFCLRMTVDMAGELEKPLIGVGINDMFGTRLLSVSSAQHNGGLLAMSEATSLECEIPQLPLGPGQYSVKLVLQDRGNDVEVLENAFTFSVLDADVHGSSRGFHAGICYAPTQWRYVGQDA